MVNPMDSIKPPPPPLDLDNRPPTGTEETKKTGAPINLALPDSNPEQPTDTNKLVDDDPVSQKEIEEFLDNNPETRKIMQEMLDKMNQAGQPEKKDGSVFNMSDLFQALIDLGQALQGMATVKADQLNLITTKMSGYSREITQIPVVLSGENVAFSGSESDQNAKRANFNQAFGNMLEAIRANKGLEEDKAKKVQTIMQTMKDASQSFHDFLGTFLDLVRGIASKINR